MKRFKGRRLQLGLIFLVGMGSFSIGYAGDPKFDLKNLPETLKLRAILSQQSSSGRMERRFDLAITRLEDLANFIHEQGVNANESKFLDTADKMFKETAQSFSDVVTKPTKKDGLEVEAGYKIYLARVAAIFKKAVGENNSQATNDLIMRIYERRFDEVSRLKDYDMYQKAADVLRGQISTYDIISSFTVLLIGLSIPRTSVVISSGVVAWYLRARGDRRDGQIQFDLVSAIMMGNRMEICKTQLGD